MNIKNSLILTKRYKLALSTIHMVYRLVNSTYDLKELLLRLAKLLCQILGAQYSQIILVDSTKQNSILKAIVSARTKIIIDRKSKIINGIEGKVLKTGQAQLKKTSLATPLLGEDLLGVIIIKRRAEGKAFDLFDQELLMAISEQAVTAIRNLQLYEEQQRIVLGSIKSLVILLDKKVPCAYTHSKLFSNIVMDLAEELHTSEAQIRCLQYASLLHDAGKIDIPLEILTKTTKLTSQEYGIIKSHPKKGAEIIKPLEVLKPAIPVILYHHEKFDGSGYPSGLKKGQIPLGARIMAVADAFEAMIAGRPYKNTISLKQAIEELKHNSGTQFDPKVVEAFLQVVKKRKFKKYLRIIKK